jgi:hypothetical protein
MNFVTLADEKSAWEGERKKASTCKLMVDFLFIYFYVNNDKFSVGLSISKHVTG